MRHRLRNVSLHAIERFRQRIDSKIDSDLIAHALLLLWNNSKVMSYRERCNMMKQQRVHQHPTASYRSSVYFTEHNVAIPVVLVIKDNTIVTVYQRYN